MLCITKRTEKHPNYLEIARMISAQFDGTPIPFGSSRVNKTFIIKAAAEKNDLFIKIIHPRFNHKRLLAEVAGMTQASGLGLTVPKIIKYGKINYQKHYYSFLVTKRAPGIEIFKYKSFNKNIVERVTSDIAKLHTSKSDFYGIANPVSNCYKKATSYKQYITDVFLYATKVAEKHNAVINTKEISNLSLIHQTAMERAIFDKKYYLSHKDLNVKHILVNDHFNSYIDWEWCQYLDESYDFGVFFSSLINQFGDQGIAIVKEQLKSKGLNQKNIFFHIGREQFFSVAFHNDPVKLSETEILLRIKRSAFYLKKSYNLK